LEHNFIVQYKKGANMPADYLSRLPSLPVNAVNSPSVAAFENSHLSYNCCNAKTKISGNFPVP